MSHIDSGLASLYQRAINHYRDNETKDWLVRHSIPILYFGNLRRFRKSTFKIVTAGLNPSSVEFEEDRFGHAVTALLRPDTLERALSNYFTAKPYSRWFNAFEPLLQQLGASFYGENYPGTAPPWWKAQQNVALHTDICSPLATTPKWSKLPETVTTELRKWGFPLWRDLIAALKPDMVLISVRESYLRDLGKLSWRTFNQFPDGLSKYDMKLARFGDTHIVWGRPQVVPLFYLRGRRHAATAAQAILEQPEFKSLLGRKS